MVQINLTTEESRTIGNYAAKIIAGLQERIERHPIIVLKAQTIIAETNLLKGRKGEGESLVEALMDALDENPAARAQEFLDQEKSAYQQMQDELHHWMSLEAQIKSAVV
jgi:hypothetical protein